MSENNIMLQSPNVRMRYAVLRNRILGSARFQHWASRIPIIRIIARHKAAAQFDLVAGFVYSQILFACVETGLIDFLHGSVRTKVELVGHLGLSEHAADRLLRGAAALNLLENPVADQWILGAEGAQMSANPGAMAMVRHHALLYRDMANPLALLRADREQETALSAYWSYAAKSEHGGQGDVAPYSALMAATQPMVAQQILAAYDFSRHTSMLDIGGGSGAFVAAVAVHAPAMRCAIFDMPAVIAQTKHHISVGAQSGKPELFGGSFKTDSIPVGFDLITLVRIAHDHDDGVVAALLAKTHAALPSGGKLLIVEPMAAEKAAPRMGDAYFGFYLWAMGSGRPRTADTLSTMLKQAGFSQIRRIKTAQPLITSAIIASR